MRTTLQGTITYPAIGEGILIIFKTAKWKGMCQFPGGQLSIHITKASHECIDCTLYTRFETLMLAHKTETDFSTAHVSMTCHVEHQAGLS